MAASLGESFFQQPLGKKLQELSAPALNLQKST